MKIDEAFLVGLVAFSIAAACVLGIIVVAIREKKRTGRLPGELADSGGGGWFFALMFVYLTLRGEFSAVLLRRMPLCIIVPALDMAYAIALIAVAVWAMSYVFRVGWSARTSLWVSWHLCLPVLFLCNVPATVRALHTMSWVWIPAGIIAVAAAPFFGTFASLDRIIGSEPWTSAATTPMRSFRLWRPGDPQ